MGLAGAAAAGGTQGGAMCAARLYRQKARLSPGTLVVVPPGGVTM